MLLAFARPRQQNQNKTTKALTPQSMRTCCIPLHHHDRPSLLHHRMSRPVFIALHPRRRFSRRTRCFVPLALSPVPADNTIHPLHPYSRSPTSSRWRNPALTLCSTYTAWMPPSPACGIPLPLTRTPCHRRWHRSRRWHAFDRAARCARLASGRPRCAAAQQRARQQPASAAAASLNTH